jgi:hypothetical protein
MVTITVKFMSIARQRAEAGVVEFTSQESKLRYVLKEIVRAYRIADIMLEKGRNDRKGRSEAVGASSS